MVISESDHRKKKLSMKVYFYILPAILLFFFSPLILNISADIIAYAYGCQIHLDEIKCSAGDASVPIVAAFALDICLLALRLLFFVPLIAAMFFFIWLLLILRYALLRIETKSK
ncbi:hypothetical protein AGR4A_Cc80017 [Agrobacterium tumefaciens str. B6]|uniref:Transmembrane protein n=1 Tax=Agrobacterium tumefaciens str. B6 TaxID=1183423 RepID=A0A822V5I9_AGRTU|nr:hypothetical protein AGR4A_Cc80017 [Agrobacterium tumefaciens str. B6]